METIKANILKAISEEHASVYQFLKSFVKEVEIDESLETKIVHTVYNSLQRWAEARISMHRELGGLIRSAESHKTKIQNNLVVDAGWVTADKYNEYIVEAKKLENESAQCLRFIGLDLNESGSVFAKVSSLIEYK